MDATYAVNESIRETTDGSWILAEKLLLSRQSSPSSSQPSWSDGENSFFVLSEATGPMPESRPLSNTSIIRKVYDAGAASAVWRVGEAFIKVKKLLVPKATREHVTLEFLHHHKASLSFDIPYVHYHAEVDGRYYLVTSRLPGQTLGEAWPGMDERTKQHYVDRIATICEQLAVLKGDSITGVDGHHISDLWLSGFGENDCDPQHLVNNCKDVGMDCSSFVFYHCDLGPGNIVLNLAEDSIAILDWEIAGFVPREWIHTKFYFCSGLDLPFGDEDERVDYRRRMIGGLEAMGSLEVAEKWWAWYKADRVVDS